MWWILTQFWKQGLLFQDYKVVPYCPRCGTALSSHELAMGYQMVTDPSVYVRFPLLAADGSPETRDGLPVSLLVWTTTPWTLISNVAAAVGPDIEYALARRGDEYLILAAAPGGAGAGAGGGGRGDVPGLGAGGPQLPAAVPFRRAGQAAWFVITGGFVTTEEGTGIVHIAPAFGAEDMVVGREFDLPVVMPVDLECRFTAEVTPYAGMFVKDADARIMDDLEKAGILFAREPYEHSYPHCWRCDTPLIYYAKSSWYVQTTARKDDLLAANEEITWYPDNLKHGRFGNWLENNIDWSLSRERYWGTPLPVWRCPNGHDHAVESRAELSALTGRDLSDLELHRPYVDEITFACPECGDESHRVPEVIDAWFDSGSMPIAQWHYPFENEETLEEALPRRFHLRGHRPDPGMVLQPARHQRTAHRPHLLQERGLPGPHPGRRRPQDVQARGQRGGPLERAERAGCRRAALVPVHGVVAVVRRAASARRTSTRSSASSCSPSGTPTASTRCTRISTISTRAPTTCPPPSAA